jgi:hypothetical protein
LTQFEGAGRRLVDVALTHHLDDLTEGSPSSRGKGMRRLKVPDGSYVNPGAIDRVQIDKHFWGKNYYVQIHLDDGRTIDLCEQLSEEKAKELRGDYERQLEALDADISSYKEGKRIGFFNGKKEGYSQGHRDGYKEGLVGAQLEANGAAYRSGIETVLEQLYIQRSEFNDEMRFEAHLIDSRRQLLIAMTDLIDRLVAMFTPRQYDESDPSNC